MAIGALTLAGANFLLYVLLRRIDRWLSYIQLFLLFIFAFVISDRSFSIFYLMMFVVAVLISELNPNVRAEEQQSKKRGFGFTILMLSIGVVMYILIALVSSSVGGNIIGVPNLAVSTAADIGKAFKPTLEASLGIIENFFTFAVFEALLAFGMLIPLVGRLIQVTVIALPLLITAFIMAIFHVSAYSVSVVLILWAMFAFGLFILSRYFAKDSLPADTGHYLNNLIVSAQRNLRVVF